VTSEEAVPRATDFHAWQTENPLAGNGRVRLDVGEQVLDYRLTARPDRSFRFHFEAVRELEGFFATRFAQIDEQTLVVGGVGAGGAGQLVALQYGEADNQLGSHVLWKGLTVRAPIDLNTLAVFGRSDRSDTRIAWLDAVTPSIATYDLVTGEMQVVATGSPLSGLRYLSARRTRSGAEVEASDGPFGHSGFPPGGRNVRIVDDDGDGRFDRAPEGIRLHP